MRFIADGPDIPLSLIEARDAGDVIFLCGAGVSMPAGLPDFRKLTENVAKRLRVHPSDPIAQMLANTSAPLDQTFGQMMGKYGFDHVEAAVRRELRITRAHDTARHKTILRLSSDREGRRRLITTNFDHLFERAQPGLRRIAPPVLPDLAVAGPLDGIVYLHGRLASGAAGVDPASLVLASADFGRAYLSAGWATRFIRQILDRYTLVLLGYSAEDPPVRYLLEGLHAEGAGRNPIYTFASGEPGAAQARWSERGVRAITYRDHGLMWRSLQAWAELADDPGAWRRAVAALAARPPAELAPHERGQVAALVSTAQGAKVFAEQTPAPPATWLMVLDPAVRLSEPKVRPIVVDDQPRDPLDDYGLDSDPDREAIVAGLEVKPPDLLAPLEGEDTEVMSPRLRSLSWWVAKVMEEPAVLWWLADGGGPGPGPEILEMLERSLDLGAVNNPDQRMLWRLLLEALRARRAPRQDLENLRARVARFGWATGDLRALRSALRPSLICRRHHYQGPFPPAVFESVYGLIDFDVEFPEVDCAEFAIDPTLLAPFMAAWREALAKGAELMADVPTGVWWEAPTLYPTGHGHRMHDDASNFYVTVAGLIDRLADQEPAAARAEISLWPSESIFFDKLRTWCWRRADLAGPDEVVAGMLGLPDNGFWAQRSTRDILHTLRARWPDLSPSDRARLEGRLVGGPPCEEDEAEAAFKPRASQAAATRLGWLAQNGCDLSASTLAALTPLRAAIPGWSAEWDAEADFSWEGRTGMVRRESDPAPLLDVPLAEAARRAQARETHEDPFHEAVPFEGLLATRPSRALSILGHEQRAGRTAEALWQKALDREGLVWTARRRRLAAGRLLKLPAESLVLLRFSLSRWILAEFSKLAAEVPDLAFRLWDAVFDNLLAAGPAAARSGIGERRTRSGVLPESRRTHTHAKFSPTGRLTLALLGEVERRGALRPPVPAGDIRQRLDLALEAPGEAGDYAIAMIASYLDWLEGKDRAYVRSVLIPMLRGGHPRLEPAWSGLLAGGPPRSSLFKALKAEFLDLPVQCASWTWAADARSRCAQWAVILMVDRPRSGLTASEACRILQDDGVEACDGAQQQLQRLQTEGRAWVDIERFLLAAWPKERKFATAALSQRLVALAAQAGPAFPRAVRTILPYLSPVEQNDLFVVRLQRERQGQLSHAARFPESSLALLDKVVPHSAPRPPHDLARVLDEIATSAPDLKTSQAWRRLVNLTL